MDVAGFSASAYLVTRMVGRRAMTPAAAGAWIAREAARMGPLFLKLAQLVSAREDAIDPDLARALSVVQDRVDVERPEPPRPPEGFVVTGTRPIKAGSVAAVWKGVREVDGSEVAIKALHPGVRAAFELDLPLVGGVLDAAAGVGVPGAENFAEIVRESAAMLVAETDLAREAAAMRAFGEIAPPGVVVPRVLASTESCIVQQFVPARKISEVRGPNPALARRLMATYAFTVMRTGLAHGDPHPGNVGVAPDGRLVLYDWGASVDTSPIRAGLGRMLAAAATRDLDGLVAAMGDVGLVRAAGRDRKRVVALLERMARVPPAEFHVALARQPEFSSSDGRRLVRFGTDAVYLLRGLSLVEGTCRALDPDFSYERYWDLDLREVAESAASDAAGWGGGVTTWIRGLAPVVGDATEIATAVDDLRDDIVADRRETWKVAVAAGVVGAIADYVVVHLM